LGAVGYVEDTYAVELGKALSTESAKIVLNLDASVDLVAKTIGVGPVEPFAALEAGAVRVIGGAAVTGFVEVGSAGATGEKLVAIVAGLT
jgi:hypothetical protein